MLRLRHSTKFVSYWAAFLAIMWVHLIDSLVSSTTHDAYSFLTGRTPDLKPSIISPAISQGLRYLSCQPLNAAGCSFVRLRSIALQFTQALKHQFTEAKNITNSLWTFLNCWGVCDFSPLQYSVFVLSGWVAQYWSLSAKQRMLCLGSVRLLS